MILCKDLYTDKVRYIYISLRGQVYAYIYIYSQDIIIYKVSTVIVYPPFKASSCKLNNSNKNTREKIDYIFILLVLKGFYPFSPLKVLIFIVLRPFYLFYYIPFH
jgi:hypothetical protein